MFSGQNVRFSCFFSVKMTGNQKILDFYLKNSQKISLLEAATASKIDRFSIWRCQNDRKTIPNKIYLVDFFQKCIKILR